MVGHAGSPTRTVYADVTLTRSKVKVKVTGLLNIRQLANPCMLAAIIAALLRGLLFNMLHGLCDIRLSLLTMHPEIHVTIVLNLINSSVLLTLASTF